VDERPNGCGIAPATISVFWPKPHRLWVKRGVDRSSGPNYHAPAIIFFKLFGVRPGVGIGGQAAAGPFSIWIHSQYVARVPERREVDSRP